MKIKTVILFLLIGMQLNAQSLKPDLQDAKKWQLINRTAEPVFENGKKGVRFNEVPDAGLMILKDYEFSDGTIEFDVKGKNELQKSFVGVAFHLQDENTYDGVYFRPFNFENPDTVRRPRSVQYVSMPQYSWPTLREKFPGKYENKVNPVPNPDDWFHVKILLKGKSVKVFVNDSSKPSLEVEKLSQTTKGKFALTLGNNSGGSFANVVITPSK